LAAIILGNSGRLNGCRDQANENLVVVALLSRAVSDVCLREGTRYREANDEDCDSLACVGGNCNRVLTPLGRTDVAAISRKRGCYGKRPLCDRDRSCLRFLPYSSRRGRTATARHEVSWRSGYRRPGLPRRGTQHYP